RRGGPAAVHAAASDGLPYAHTQPPPPRAPPMTAATGQLLVGAVVLTPFAAVTTATDGIELTPARVGAILALGVMGTGVAYWINCGGIARVGATAASMVTYLIPPLARTAGCIL